MKKAVTVFSILTPVALLIWILAFCLEGIIGVGVDNFLANILERVNAFANLWPIKFEGIYNIAVYSVAIALVVGLLLYFIIPPVRRRPAYIWHFILAIFATVPVAFTLVNFEYYLGLYGSEEIGPKIISLFLFASAGLTTLFMFITFLLSFIDCMANPGKRKKPSKHDKALQERPAPTETLTPVSALNGLTVKAIPRSEPVKVKKESDLVTDIRQIVHEELETMRSQLQVRQNVVSSVVAMSKGDTDGRPVVVDSKNKKDNPVKIVIMMDEQRRAQEKAANKGPEIVPMVETPVSEDENVNLIEEPLVETTPRYVEEPLDELGDVEEPPVEEPEVENVEEPLQEDIPMEEPAHDEPQIEVVEETHVEETFLEEPEEEPQPEEEIPMVEEIPIVDEEDVKEEITFLDEPTPEEAEEYEELGVISEDDIVEEPEPVVEEAPAEEEPVKFEEEPEGLVATENPDFLEEPEPEEEEKIAEKVIVPAPVEEKPTYERISFMDRMINTDDVMKAHYNELKNEILSYGVKSRVSNSGDAFRLHTKTYVKITIAGKSLKLYFALDPKDYADTKIPFQDAGHKGIYAEIPFVFKVKSDLSMKRAKELIADTMAKDSLEKQPIESIDYVEALKDEVASQDSED